MVSVHPHFFARFGGGKRERAHFIVSSTVVKPVDDTDVRDLRVSKFFDVCEYLLPFFLPGSLVCVLKVVYGINLGHCQFQLEGGKARRLGAHL